MISKKKDSATHGGTKSNLETDKVQLIKKSSYERKVPQKRKVVVRKKVIARPLKETSEHKTATKLHETTHETQLSSSAPQETLKDSAALPEVKQPSTTSSKPSSTPDAERAKPRVGTILRRDNALQRTVQRTPNNRSSNYQRSERSPTHRGGSFRSSSPTARHSGVHRSPTSRSHFSERSSTASSGGRTQNFRHGSSSTTAGRRATGVSTPRGNAGSGRLTKPSADLTTANKTTGKRFGRSPKKNTTFVRREDKRKELEQTFSLKKQENVVVNPVPKEIYITEVITVADLARKMNLKGSDLIGKLMRIGMMVTINQQIDSETATLLASEYGSQVKVVSLYDETVIQADTVADEVKQNRPPVVTVMGHVDHGKTQLLDTIRSSNVASKEHGGITQHIGAYQVNQAQGLITFLDTPGHEAFSLMRARGAAVTDIVVLVVSASDGVMPQTLEALHHAQEAKVPIIVAINKMDLPEANPERVKQQLSEHQLVPEEWGGNVQYVEVSALAGTHIDLLLEKIALEAELLDLKVGFDCRASGRVIESFVDQGRGIVATVLSQEGTLRIGDSFVAGVYSGKIRAMFNEYGERLQKAAPSRPVEIIGFNGCPDAGAPFHVVESEKQAKILEQKRQELQKLEKASTVKKVSLDNLYDTISEGELQELRIIIKGDVHGSVEALQQLLEKLSNDTIRLRCLHAAAGAIVESDVSLAAASEAIIIGFHVRPTPRAQMLAEKERIEIRKYNVIYDAIDDVRQKMEGMLAPELNERQIAVAEVRELFKISRLGTIAGCMVTSGTMSRDAHIRVMRAGEQIFEGKLATLKRFKDDVKEVREGFECGVMLSNFNDLHIEDQLQAFIIESTARKLASVSGNKL